MDIELSKAKPDGAAQIIQHFTKPDVEADIAEIDREARAELPNPLDFKELSEQLAAEIDEAQNQAAFWDGRLKSLKDQAKGLAGQERGQIARGNYIFDLKESKARVSVKGEDYERYIKDNMTDAAVKECREKYARTGDPVVSLSVKKFR